MTPPVALLVYRPERPQDSVYYPFAGFSPEWQAIKYAHDRGIPARFMDLPIAHQIGEDDPAEETEPGPATPPGDDDPRPPRRRPVDPLGLLAQAAGFDDGERWWEFAVE